MKKAAFSIRLTKEEQERMAKRCHFEETQLYRIAALEEALAPLLRAEGYYELLTGPESAAFLPDGTNEPCRGQSGAIGRIRRQGRVISKAERRDQTDEAAGRGDSPNETAALCAVTLGSGIDDMQALYGGAEAVMDDYILECLGSALLEKAYEELADLLRRETGLFLNRYLFPGSQVELTQIAEIIGRLSSGGELIPISYNKDFVLTPKKSVVFIGILGEKKSGCGICADCPKTDCESRVETSGTDDRETDRTETERTKGSRAETGNYSYGYQRIFGRYGKE